MILELLGSGAMGDVYKCIAQSTGQLVAIKWLHRLEMAKRFANEANTLAQINHPNIAQFVNYVHATDFAFIVMEYVEGLTIEKLISHSGKLPESYAKRILLQLAQAVKYLHDQNIVHRDIKAANIKVKQNSQVKLLDFGIAKTKFSERLTAEGLVVGSMPYIAPEQFEGTTTPKVDLWSLGVLYYQMITSYLPFSGNGDIAIRDSIKRGQYLAPEVFEPNISKQSQNIVKHLLNPIVHQRWSIDQLISNLDDKEDNDRGKTMLQSLRTWIGKIK